jgi:hypothetical protein
VLPFPLVILDALLVHAESADLSLIGNLVETKGMIWHLSIDTSLSSSSRNLAVTGESGIKTLFKMS